MTVDILFSKVLNNYIEIEYGDALRCIRFIRREKHLKEQISHNATHELMRYFEGEIVDFGSDVEIDHLSPFVQKVLKETIKIKYGQTLTYSELADKIGSRAVRAVGNALGKNPVPIIIPCHRVVSKKGIGGYSLGVGMKIRLLELEKRSITFNISRMNER